VTNEPRGDAAGDFVRPFVITGGRTRAADTSMRMETLVQTVGARSGGHLTFEHARIAELCREPASIAEVAANLHVPLGVAMVLVADLVAQDRLAVYDSNPVEIELSTLTRMINRVRTL
jgi:hypothetical protein